MSCNAVLGIGLSFPHHRTCDKSRHCRPKAFHSHFPPLSSSSLSTIRCLLRDSDSSSSDESINGYDELQALILSAPYDTSNIKGRSSAHFTSNPPTLLEREALAVESDVCRRQRSEAMDELLDLLDFKGVPPGFAFEFLRHSTELIDDLIRTGNKALAAKPLSTAAASHGVQMAGYSVASVLKERDSNRSSASSGKAMVDMEMNGAHHFQRLSCGLQRQKMEGSLETDCSFPSIVSYFAEQAGIPRLVYYFYMLKMRAPDLAKVFPFVGNRIDTVMAKVEFLRTIGVASKSLPTVLASWPQLFMYECDQLALVEESLKVLGFSHKELGNFVQKHPQVLGMDIEKDLQPNLEFLQDLGVPEEHVKKLIIRHPVLILKGAEKSLRPLIACLENIGVKRHHIGLLLVRRPSLVSSDVEKDVLPVGVYLKSIHATADDIDKIITSFPRLFQYNLGEDFQPAVLQLENLGVDSILMGKIFRRHPQLLKNRLSFEAKTNFLVNLGLEKKDLGRVIYNAPQLLGLSVEEKIQPTIQFLESLGITKSSLLKVLR